MTKISVIVPVYNVEEYLPKCLDSLVNQTFDDFEVIVINDGSPDNSQDIIDEYQQKYPNLIKSFVKENGGLSQARNFALDKVTGDYVFYLDSDDWVDTQILEKLYSKVESKQADIVVCGAYSVLNDSKTEIDRYDYSSDVNKNYILYRPSAWCKLIKKDILKNKEIKFLEKHIYEDIAIMPALCLYANKISFVEEPLYFYLVREGSIMNQRKYSKSLEDIFDSLDYLENLFIAKDSFEKYKDELEYLYIKNLLHAASLRFLPFDEGRENILRIADTVKEKFPKWRKNKYYKKEDFKYKIICNLVYMKKIKMLKKILKV